MKIFELLFFNPFVSFVGKRGKGHKGFTFKW